MLLLIFILSGLISYSQSSERKEINIDPILTGMSKREKASVGKYFPDFKIKSGSIEYTNLKLKGKIVFINFWFASCPPCIAEFEELNKLYVKFKDNANFEFISLTFEDSAQIEFIKKSYEILYKVISIPKQECYRLNLNNGFPTSIILDKEGKIKLIHAGGSLSKEDIRKYFLKNYYLLLSEEL